MADSHSTHLTFAKSAATALSISVGEKSPSRAILWAIFLKSPISARFLVFRTPIQCGAHYDPTECFSCECSTSANQSTFGRPSLLWSNLDDLQFFAASPTFPALPTFVSAQPPQFTLPNLKVWCCQTIHHHQLWVPVLTSDSNWIGKRGWHLMAPIRDWSNFVA